jgi:hypothetical protein
MARFNQGIYNAIISMGGSAASANNAARARRPGRAFRRFQAAFVPPQCLKHHNTEHQLLQTLRLVH